MTALSRPIVAMSIIGALAFGAFGGYAVASVVYGIGAKALRARACDEFQGFYFSKAVTAAKFTELLEAQTPMAVEEA